MRRANDTSDDCHLVERARSGDSDAFVLLIHRHRQHVAALASAYLGGRTEDIEDIVQETFIRAFVTMRSFQGRSSFATWLLRITINLCKDLRKSAWSQRVLLADDVNEEDRDGCALDTSTVTPESLAIAKDERERIQAVLRELDEVSRAAIQLRFFEEMDYREIASVMGIPASTIRFKIARALVLLGEKITQPEENPCAREPRMRQARGEINELRPC